MDIEQDADPFNHLELIKTEPAIDPDQTKPNEHCYDYSDISEYQRMEQLGHLDKIKEEMPEIERRSNDFPTKVDHDIVSENIHSFPIKQKLENTSRDIKMIDISDIKQEVSEYIVKSELLTSHCDLPTLKIENIDCQDYYLGHPSSSKPLENTSNGILKTKMRYPCPICQKNFPASKPRSTHIEGHFKKRYAVCQFCGKILKKIECYQHFFIHVVKNRAKNRINNKSLTYNLYSKKKNNLDYVDNKSIIIHSGEKPFKCDICNKHFKYKCLLQRHLITHSDEKPFNCDICSKNFSQKCHLQQHLVSHSSEKPFKCDICFKGYIGKYHLQRHLIIHSDEKPFKCDICSKEYNDKSSLRRHSRNHNGEKPFKCDVCSKGFNDKSHLRIHLIIHSSEKPFNCDICLKRFKHKSGVQKHLIIHSGEIPFKCDICDKKFIQKSTLQNHLTRNH